MAPRDHRLKKKKKNNKKKEVNGGVLKIQKNTTGKISSSDSILSDLNWYKFKLRDPFSDFYCDGFCFLIRILFRSEYFWFKMRGYDRGSLDLNMLWFPFWFLETVNMLNRYRFWLLMLWFWYFDEICETREAKHDPDPSVNSGYDLV